MIFNPEDVDSPDDIATIPGEAQTEGERDKVIQASLKNIQTAQETEETPDKHQSDHQPTNEDETTSHQMDGNSPQTQNEETSLESDQIDPDNDASSSQDYGRGKRTQRQEGSYWTLNEGLVAAVSTLHEDQTLDEVEEDVYSSYSLPPDVALAGYSFSDPTMLDKAL